jgi:Ankyrin repeats (3 copies)
VERSRKQEAGITSKRSQAEKRAAEETAEVVLLPAVVEQDAVVATAEAAGSLDSAEVSTAVVTSATATADKCAADTTAVAPVAVGSNTVAAAAANVEPELSSIFIANEDLQKLVFDFVGARQWLVMGAVCEQWQHMYKQHVKTMYLQSVVLERQAQKKQRRIIVGDYNDTGYWVAFASEARLQMGVDSGMLNLKGSKVQQSAGRYSSEAVLLLARKLGMPWSADVLRGVAVSANVSKMRWLLTQHIANLPADIMDFAAEAGSIDMLNLLQQRKARFTAETSVRAVKPGRLRLLKYLNGQRCPLHWQTAMAAVKRGDLDILKYLHKTGCEFSLDYALWYCASSIGTLELVKWLVEQGAPLSSSVLHTTALDKRLDICEYLMERGCEWTAGITDATIHFNPDLIPWAVSHGVTLTAEQQMKLDERNKYGQRSQRSAETAE